MRSTPWARWATCALAVSIVSVGLPALAERAKRTIADCTAFDQADKGDDAVQFTIHNGCSMKLDTKAAAAMNNTEGPNLTSGGKTSVDRYSLKLYGDRGRVLRARAFIDSGILLDEYQGNNQEFLSALAGG